MGIHVSNIFGSYQTLEESKLKGFGLGTSCPRLLHQYPKGLGARLAGNLGLRYVLARYGVLFLSPYHTRARFNVRNSPPCIGCRSNQC
jgi:hypothetical protein